MSKMPLAVKYRPKTFEDLTEQFSIAKILTYQVNTGTNKNSYLFTGPAGTGKTTSARIFGTMLNDGVKNLIELDAASNNSVDDIRKIIEEAKFQDLSSKYKIYIIDECHMLSTGAWNALLKLLEEPPLTTIFILCTTDAQKIPKTILSRVQRYDFKKISYDGIIKRLVYILTKEQEEGNDILYYPDAIEYIARISEGGMRDAITLLDKALAYDKNVTLKGLADALNLPSYDDYFTLLNGIAKKDNEVIIRMINDVYDSGVNFVRWFEGFHSFVCNIVKYIFMQDINSTMIPGYYKEKISAYGQSHSLLCLKLAKKLIDLNTDLKSTQYLQETAITYLCYSNKR